MRLRIDRSVPPAGRVLRVTLILLGLGTLGAARWFPFGSLPPLCGFKFFTGFPCAACGMTRAWVHLMHGRLGEALALSPLGVLLWGAVVLAIAYGVGRSWGLPAVRSDLSRAESLALRTAVVLAFLLNWGYVLRAGLV